MLRAFATSCRLMLLPQTLRLASYAAVADACRCRFTPLFRCYHSQYFGVVLPRQGFSCLRYLTATVAYFAPVVSMLADVLMPLMPPLYVSPLIRHYFSPPAIFSPLFFHDIFQRLCRRCRLRLSMPLLLRYALRRLFRFDRYAQRFSLDAVYFLIA